MSAAEIVAARLEALLPAGVLVAVRTPSESVDAVMEEEVRRVEKAAAVRRAQFLAARSAARTLLRSLGEADRPLLPGADRAPVWPKGIVGSLSHSHALCAAIVARTDDFRALGVDLEPDEALETRLWPRILSETERAGLAQIDERTRGRIARVLFSAKESFYKAQYPLTRRFLGFHEAEIGLELAGRRFEVTPRVDLGLGRDVSWRGRYDFAGDHCMTIVTLAR